MIDLHQHSYFSDGTDSVEKLITNNINKGIKIMALTDHDTIDGCKYYWNNCKNSNISFINGIEFSTKDKKGNVHLLLYGYDIDSPVVNQLLNKVKSLRRQRIQFRLDILSNDYKINLPEEYISKINASSNPNKVMLANFLVELGYGNNIQNVIDKYLFHKVPDLKIDVTEILDTIKSENIIPCLAHPLGGVGEPRIDFDTLENRIQELKLHGLRALECYYSLYTLDEINSLVDLAHKNGLLVSAGSDYHGKNKSVNIGETSSCNVNPTINDITILTELM